MHIYNVGDRVIFNDKAGEERVGKAGTVISVEKSNIQERNQFLSIRMDNGRQSYSFDHRVDPEFKADDLNIQTMKGLTDALNAHTAALLAHTEAITEHAFQLDLSRE